MRLAGHIPPQTALLEPEARLQWVVIRSTKGAGGVVFQRQRRRGGVEGQHLGSLEVIQQCRADQDVVENLGIAVKDECPGFGFSQMEQSAPSNTSMPPGFDLDDRCLSGSVGRCLV